MSGSNTPGSPGAAPPANEGGAGGGAGAGAAPPPVVTPPAGAPPPPAGGAPDQAAAAKAAEEKAAAEKAAADKAAADKAAADLKAKGVIELKPIEGLAIDDKTLASFKDKAKELGLDSSKAQGLLEFYATTQKAALDAQANAAGQIIDGWTKTLQTDKEFGGAKLQATTAAAERAMQRFGSPELKKWFDETGVGQHPELVKTMARVGAAIKEDSVAGTAQPATGAEDPAARLKRKYDKSPQLFENKP